MKTLSQHQINLLSFLANMQNTRYLDVPKPHRQITLVDFNALEVSGYIEVLYHQRGGIVSMQITAEGRAALRVAEPA